MAFVKTFRINPEYGVPDRDIREWLSLYEKKATLAIQTTFIPALGKADPRLTVIATVVDAPLSDEIEPQADVEDSTN